MNLCNDTISVLKNFSSINPSIEFKKGSVLKTMSPSKSVLAKATLKDEIEADFAIYDLSRFLGVVSLFENPVYSVGENSLTIESDGRTVNYTYCEPDSILTPPNKELDIGEPDVEFTMCKDHFSEIMRALGVMSLPDFVVVGDGSSIYLRAVNSKNPSSDKYDVKVGETDKVFNVIFRTENMKLFPADYNVAIVSKGISHFKSDNIEYWVAIESTSTFE